MAGNENSGRRAENRGRNTRKNITDEELELINNLRRIEDEAISQGLNPKDVKHGWLKTKESSLFFKNPLFSDGGLDELAIARVVDRLVEKHKTTFVRKSIPKPEKESDVLLKVIVSDAHVGMNPNPDGNALFQYEYNSEIYQESMDKILTSVEKEFSTYGFFDEIHILDLGDLADGWNGYTTRGGHELPQNLTNDQVFELCVDTKVSMIRELVESNKANRIILRSICNDNHSGDFGLIINLTIKKMINLLYRDEVVEVDIIRRFIEHRIYGDHCFILTHGKDKKERKIGFPIVLNDNAIRIINDYIEHYEIRSKFIHVEKGDLHQIGYQRTKKFDYRNYMSFAPPSSWIQHNFGDSYSGYSTQVVHKETNDICHTDYFLDYKKKK